MRDNIRITLRITNILFQGIVLVGILVPFLIGICIEINIRTTPNIYWFVVPAFAIVFGLLMKASDWFEFVKRPIPKHSITKLILIAALLGIALGALDLVFEYIDHRDLLLTGNLLLPGDSYAAPRFTRTVISLFLLGAAGAIEETAIRYAIQFRLQDIITRQWIAEIIADTLFVAMHFERISDKYEIAATVGIAMACGRMATYTQNIRLPIFIHSLANIVNAVAILVLRN